MMKIRNQEMDLLPWLMKKNKREEKVLISIRITISGIRSEVSSEIFISPKDWDGEHKVILKSDKDYKTKNQQLQALKVDLKRCFDILCLQKDKIKPIEVKNLFKGKNQEPQTETPEHPTQIQVMDEFIDKFEKLVEKGKRSKFTHTQWRSTRKKLQEFLQFTYKDHDIEFPEISTAFGDELYDYQTLEVDNPLSDATAKKHIKKIKQIIKIGVKKGIILVNPIADFVCGGDQKEIPPLEFKDVL